MRPRVPQGVLRWMAWSPQLQLSSVPVAVGDGGARATHREEGEWWYPHVVFFEMMNEYLLMYVHRMMMMMINFWYHWHMLIPILTLALCVFEELCKGFFSVFRCCNKERVVCLIFVESYVVNIVFINDGGLHESLFIYL